jgi:di/tricarboxylate transporter
LPTTQWNVDALESEAVGIAEAVLAPRSTLLGQTLRTSRFREKYGMNVLGIWRAGRPIRSNLSDLPLAYGDALLLHGARERMPLLRTEPDLILMNGNGHDRPVVVTRWKRWLAPAIMLGALVFAALNSALVGEIMLGATVLMVLAKILSMDQAYGAIEWRSVFLVAGMLPLGLAMTKSGAAGLLADNLVRVLGSAGPLAMLAGLFLLTTLLTQTMNGAAVATVIAPIAIGAAQQTGLDPRALAMGVALASSMAFLTPLGHPVNILVMGPGGYKFKDFLKVGWLLYLLIFALVMLLLPVVWPLTKG